MVQLCGRVRSGRLRPPLPLSLSGYVPRSESKCTTSSGGGLPASGGDDRGADYAVRPPAAGVFRCVSAPRRGRFVRAPGCSPLVASRLERHRKLRAERPPGACAHRSAVGAPERETAVRGEHALAASECESSHFGGFPAAASTRLAACGGRVHFPIPVAPGPLPV